MKADRDKVLRLLKTARGQMDGLIKMVEDDRYCVDISNQLMAVQAVLRNANGEILKGHLNHCVKEAVESGGGDAKLNEFSDIIDKLLKS